MNVLDLALRKVKLKKVSGTNGGEWQGPCPGCGDMTRSDSDRFHVWPNQNEAKGAYWCRGCGKTGDNIQFLRDFEGMSFRDACAQLNIELPDHSGADHNRPDPPRQYTKPVFEPKTHANPADLWQEKADKFVTWAQEGLANNPEALAWLAARGISATTARNYRLGWNAGEKGHDVYRPRPSWGVPQELKEDGKPRMLWLPIGVVIPIIADRVIHRIRIRRFEAAGNSYKPFAGKNKYCFVPGSAGTTMVLEPDRRAFVIIEAELDAIAVVGAGTLAGAVALGTLEGKPDAAACAILRESLQILNALDYGDLGGGAKAAERALAWWKEQFPQCDRWPVPKGKDPGEAFQMGIDLGSWIKAGLPPALTISVNAAPKILDTERGGHAKASDISSDGGNTTPPAISADLPADVRELLTLLRNNSAVKIINTPDRYTVLRHGKYVGGRINELVFHSPEVMAWIGNHPAAEIDGLNLVSWEHIK